MSCENHITVQLVIFRVSVCCGPPLRLGNLYWPHIYLLSPEELELKLMLMSFMCVHVLPVVRPLCV